MKTPLCLFLILVLGSNPLRAGKLYEEPSPVTKSSPYKKFVHFNPLALTVGGFELGYEKSITNKESFYVNLGYYLSEEAGFLDIKNEYADMNGFKLELQYRFYRKTNNYIRNVYLAPFLNFKTMSADRVIESYTYNPYTVKTTIESQSSTTVSFGYMLGMRKSIFENIYLDMSIGGGIFLPVQGDHHKDMHLGFINPYQKGVQFKGAFGLLIAL